MKLLVYSQLCCTIFLCALQEQKPPESWLLSAQERQALHNANELLERQRVSSGIDLKEVEMNRHAAEVLPYQQSLRYRFVKLFCCCT